MSIVGFKARFKAFCEGLEMERVDEMVKLPPDTLRHLGEALASNIKYAKAETQRVSVNTARLMMLVDRVLDFKHAYNEGDEQQIEKARKELFRTVEEARLR